MMGQAMYVVFVIAILDVLNLSVFKSSNLGLMIEAALVAIVLWVLIGAFLIYNAQSQMKKWYKLEMYAHDANELDKLSRTYAKIYAKWNSLGEVSHVKLKSVREQMEYLILRLNFINPVHLPSMTESYLRKDFHFAMYLSYCYGQVLTKFFKWSLFSLIILFVLIVTLNITFEAISDEDVGMYIKFTLLIISFITLILLRSCLTSAERKITPSVYEDTQEVALRDPDNFNICFNERNGSVDPFS